MTTGSSNPPAAATPVAKKDPQKPSTEIRTLINDHLKMGVGLDKISANFDFDVADNPFLKQLNDFETAIKKKGWDAIPVTQPGAPGPAKTLQDLAMEIVKVHLTKFSRDIHDEAMRGEVFDPKKWEEKAKALEAAVSNVVENRANFVGAPSTALAGIHAKLNTALEAAATEFKDLLPPQDAALATQLKQVTTNQQKAQESFKAANDLQAQQGAEKNQLQSVLDSVKALVTAEKADRAGSPDKKKPSDKDIAEDFKAIVNQKHRMQQYGRDPSYADELQTRVTAAKAVEESKWDAITQLGSYPQFTDAELALKNLEVTLTAAEKARDDAEKLVREATEELTKLGKKYEEAKAAVDAVTADPSRAAELPKLQATLTAAQDANNKQNTFKGTLEGKLRTAQDNFNVKEEAYENFKLAVDEYRQANISHATLAGELRAIQPIATQQRNLQQLAGAVPPELKPAFEVMESIKQQLSVARESPALDLIQDKADPLKKSLFDPGTAKAMLEAATEEATKVFRQEFVQFDGLKNLAPQATLSEQITKAAEIVNPQIEAQLKKIIAADKGQQFPTLEQDLKNITDKQPPDPPAEQFKELMSLAQASGALNDDKTIRRLAKFTEKAQAMQEHSVSATPKSETLIQHLEQLQALSQQQFDKQGRYHLNGLEKNIQEQHLESKKAQGAQVAGQQTLQGAFEKQAQAYIDALSKKLADTTNPVTEAEKTKIQQQITGLTDLLDQSKDASAQLTQAGGKSKDLLNDVQAQTKKMIEETAADHFEFMLVHLRRQKMGLRTAQIREQWGWGEHAHQYYAISSDMKDMNTTGRKEFGLAGKTTQAVQYEAGLIYKSIDANGKEGDYDIGFMQNKDGSYSVKAVGVDYFNAFGTLNNSAFKAATREELNFLVAAGMKSVNIMPGDVSEFEPHNRRDQHMLFEMLSGKLEVLSEKQVSLFTLDKLPKDQGSLDKLKNSYVITEGDAPKSWRHPLGGGSKLHYIDEKGVPHTLQMDQLQLESMLKSGGVLGRAGSLSGTFSGAKNKAAPDKGIEGLRRVMLNDPSQIAALREVITKSGDKKFPRNKDTGDMLGQPALSIDKAAHRKEISKLLFDGRLTKSEAAELFKKLNSLVDTPENKKDLVKSADANMQAPAPASNQDADKGQLHGVSPGASISIDLTQQGQNILTNLGGGPGNSQVLSDDSGLPNPLDQLVNDDSLAPDGQEEQPFISNLFDIDEEDEEQEEELDEAPEITVGLQNQDLDALDKLLADTSLGVDKQLQAISQRLEGMTKDDLIGDVEAGDIQMIIDKLIAIMDKQDKEDVISQHVLPAVVLAIALSEKKFAALEGEKVGEKNAAIVDLHRASQETILESAGKLIEKSGEKIETAKVDKNNEASQNFKAAAKGLSARVTHEDTDIMVSKSDKADTFNQQVEDAVKSKPTLSLGGSGGD